MGSVEIVHDDPILRAGVSENLAVLMWLDAPTLAQIRVLWRLLQRLARRYGHDFGTFSTMISGTPAFSDEVRRELIAVVRDERVQGRSAAHVLLLGGLAGVATRAFLSTVFLISRAPGENRVFQSSTEGAAWLAGQLAGGPVRWSTASVLAAHAELDAKKPTPGRPSPAAPRSVA